jgi:hypothetical protein
VVVCYAIEPSHPSQFKSFPLLFLPFPIWYPQPCARLIFILIRLLLNEHLADSIIRPSVRLCASILNCHQKWNKIFFMAKKAIIDSSQEGGRDNHLNVSPRWHTHDLITSSSPFSIHRKWCCCGYRERERDVVSNGFMDILVWMANK